MRAPILLLTAALLPLAAGAPARLYQRPVHIITSDYDLVDTTYIDRGRLDGVRVGDPFQVEFPDGKVVTDVVVTAVFERMASVKIVDSWFLKNGQIAGYNQRPMVVPLEPIARRNAPSPESRRRMHPAGPALAGQTAAPAAGAANQAQPSAQAPAPAKTDANAPATDNAGVPLPPPDTDAAPSSQASAAPGAPQVPPDAPASGAAATAGSADTNIPPPPE